MDGGGLCVGTDGGGEVSEIIIEPCTLIADAVTTLYNTCNSDNWILFNDVKIRMGNHLTENDAVTYYWRVLGERADVRRNKHIGKKRLEAALDRAVNKIHDLTGGKKSHEKIKDELMGVIK
jgi:hypothetical protein